MPSNPPFDKRSTAIGSRLARPERRAGFGGAFAASDPLAHKQGEARLEQARDETCNAFLWSVPGLRRCALVRVRATGHGVPHQAVRESDRALSQHVGPSSTDAADLLRCGSLVLSCISITTTGKQTADVWEGLQSVQRSGSSVQTAHGLRSCAWRDSHAEQRALIFDHQAGELFDDDSAAPKPGWRRAAALWGAVGKILHGSGFGFGPA